jgi:hypothetical protein
MVAGLSSRQQNATVGARLWIAENSRQFSFSVVSKKLPLEQKGHPGKGAAFSFRENSSNGAKSVKTFWRNLMSRKRGVSRNFWEINIFVFNNLQNRLTELGTDSF